MLRQGGPPGAKVWLSSLVRWSLTRLYLPGPRKSTDPGANAGRMHEMNGYGQALLLGELEDSRGRWRLLSRRPFESF